MCVFEKVVAACGGGEKVWMSKRAKATGGKRTRNDLPFATEQIISLTHAPSLTHTLSLCLSPHPRHTPSLRSIISRDREPLPFDPV